MDARVGEDDHDVGVTREEIYVGRECRVPHFHAVKLSLCFAAAFVRERRRIKFSTQYAMSKVNK